MRASRFRTRMLVVFFATLPHCASTVGSPGADASLDGSNLDASLYFDSSARWPTTPDGFAIPDSLAPSTANGRACQVGGGGARGDCGPGAACAAARIRRPSDGVWRYAFPGRCVDVERGPFLRGCDLTGRVTNAPIGMACLGFLGEDWESNTALALLTLRDCLRLREEALLQAMPGEEVAQCWFTDLTTVTSPSFPIGGCASADPAFLFGCGLGCNNCDATTHETCMFVSQSFRTGVCLPRTNPLQQTSLVCKAQNPRTACPRGQGCIFPIRGNRDDIPDRERTGICAPLARCRIVAGRLPNGYICDDTLVQ